MTHLYLYCSKKAFVFGVFVINFVLETTSSTLRESTWTLPRVGRYIHLERETGGDGEWVGDGGVRVWGVGGWYGVRIGPVDGLVDG